MHIMQIALFLLIGIALSACSSREDREAQLMMQQFVAGCVNSGTPEKICRCVIDDSGVAQSAKRLATNMKDKEYRAMFEDRITAVSASCFKQEVETPPKSKPDATIKSNNGIPYHIPRLAFEPKTIYSALERNNLAPFAHDVQKFITTPDIFISDCLKSSAKYSQDHGSLSDQESKEWAASACEQDVQQYQQCLGQTEIENIVTCFKQLSEQGD